LLRLQSNSAYNTYRSAFGGPFFWQLLKAIIPAKHTNKKYARIQLLAGHIFIGGTSRRSPGEAGHQKKQMLRKSKGKNK
jgi:hypothetical protein